MIKNLGPPPNIVQHLKILKTLLQHKKEQVGQLEIRVPEQQQILNSIFANRGEKLLSHHGQIAGMLKGLAMMPEFARLAYKIPSILLRPDDYKRIAQYLKLFGFTELYRSAVNELLRSENSYFLDADIEIIPLTRNNPQDLKVRNMHTEKATISVVIPTKNAGDEFQTLLSMIRNQKGLKYVEIIVVDSGSTDNTIEIATEFGAKIIQVRGEEFSHSYARNLGAEQARGDYLLFTVQDALPPSESWLCELLDVVRANNIVAVSCSESPRQDTDLYYAVIVWQFARFMQVDKQDRVLCKPNKENYYTLRLNSNLSNVACLIIKDVFQAYKFRGNYAEDTDLGLRLIQDGHKLAFLGSTKIIHSHNRPAYYHLKRAYVDTRFQSQTFPDFMILDHEIELLFCSIIFTYNFVNSIVFKELQQVSVPCSTRKLARIVLNAFHSAKNKSYPITINNMDNEYIDGDFKSFLTKIKSQCDLSDINQFPAKGTLFNRVRMYTMLGLEYMDNNYGLVDKDLLEEFKFYLFKVCALWFGTLLSLNWWQGSTQVKERCKEIHYKLSSDL